MKFSLLFIFSFFFKCLTSELNFNVTKENLKNLEELYDHQIYYFHFPTCEYSNQNQVFFVEASKKFQNTEIIFGLINCLEQHQLCSNYQISQFPTIKHFFQNKSHEFNQKRNVDIFLNWVNKEVNGYTKKISTEDELKIILKQHNKVIGYFGNEELFNNDLISIPALYPQIQFFHCFDDQIKKQFTKQNAIVVFKQGTEIIHQIKEKEAIFSFIEMHRVDRISQFNEDVAELIFKQKRIAVILFYSTLNQNQEALVEFQQTENFIDSEKILLSIANIEMDISHKLMKILDLSPQDLPAIRIVQADGPLSTDIVKYSFDESSMKTNKIVSFVSRFFDGKLQPFIKSQDIPDKYHEDNIRIVVGYNFESLVREEYRDVFVLFYTKTCYHCETILYQLKELARLINTGKTRIRPNTLLIAKMDATLNDVIGVKILKFPTLIFFNKKNKQKGIEYFGDRTQEGMLKWLEEQTRQSEAN